MSPNEERPGLAAERTSLAWGRMSLALLASGAALIKGIPSVTGREARPLAGTIIVALAAGGWLRSVWNERRRRRAITRGELAIDPSWLRGTALTSCLIGVVAFAIALAG